MAPKLPAGSIIVLTLAALFAFSMVFGARRGVLRRIVRSAGLRRRTDRQHLLRAAAEWMETSGEECWIIANLASMRSWSQGRLRLLHRRGVRSGDVAVTDDRFMLTKAGRLAADRVVRNHRLWELFLIRHADIAASHVDRDADLVEHVLGEEAVAELEQVLARDDATPQSPHPLGDDL
jgi:manganese/zinc/iron transport system permease protein